MSVAALIFASLVVMALWGLALYGWFESREIWNRGVCAESGKPWQVFEIGGVLHLDNCVGRRVKLNYMVVYPAISDAMKQQVRRSHSRRADA